MPVCDPKIRLTVNNNKLFIVRRCIYTTPYSFEPKHPITAHGIWHNVKLRFKWKRNENVTFARLKAEYEQAEEEAQNRKTKMENWKKDQLKQDVSDFKSTLKSYIDILSLIVMILSLIVSWVYNHKNIELIKKKFHREEITQSQPATSSFAYKCAVWAGLATGGAIVYSVITGWLNN